MLAECQGQLKYKKAQHKLDTGEQSEAFVPFRMCDKNTTVPRRAAHTHFDWSSDGSCHSPDFSQLSTKLAELLASTMYSLQFTAYIAHCTVYSVQLTVYSLQCTVHGSCLCSVCINSSQPYTWDGALPDQGQSSAPTGVEHTTH